jgi:hypothetical protein
LQISETGDRLPRDSVAAFELEKREGALVWPERFGRREISAIKAELGPYRENLLSADMYTSGEYAPFRRHRALPQSPAGHVGSAAFDRNACCRSTCRKVEVTYLEVAAKVSSWA